MRSAPIPLRKGGPRQRGFSLEPQRHRARASGRQPSNLQASLSIYRIDLDMLGNPRFSC